MVDGTTYLMLWLEIVQAKQEIEELRKNLQDSTRLKATYEHLKQVC
jgi:hypothetical protein